ncbi:hypothetical protein BH11BAC2_BH11BAC2_08720 [soil metagenome]
MLGNEIKNISFSGTQLILNKSTMSPGMYFLQIISENSKVETQKIIVQ